MSAFYQVFILPGPEAVYHILVGQFQHPPVFPHFHLMVYLQFELFPFYFEYFQSIRLFGFIQYFQFIIQELLFLRIQVEFLIHDTGTYRLGELLVCRSHFPHNQIERIILQIVDVIGSVIPFYVGKYVTECLHIL